jgi:hypothetical protein
MEDQAAVSQAAEQLSTLLNLTIQDLLEKGFAVTIAPVKDFNAVQDSEGCAVDISNKITTSKVT